jgi:hypothetical protein
MTKELDFLKGLLTEILHDDLWRGNGCRQCLVGKDNGTIDVQFVTDGNIVTQNCSVFYAGPTSNSCTPSND